MKHKKEVGTVLRGNTELSKDIYRLLAKQTGNIIFSPIGIHATLSLLAQGAAGTTEKALVEALHIPDAAVAKAAYKVVMKNLNTVKKVTLSVANGMFSSCQLQEEFQKVITNRFYSEVKNLDFSKSASAADSINSWVQKKTNGKIKDIIDAAHLTEDTRMVLVNAVYFLGTWAEPFRKKFTNTSKFYVNASDTIDVQMMHNLDEFGYKNDGNLNAKILELPYRNKDVSLVVILPNERDGIADLEQKLASTDLTQIATDMYRPEVSVALPKFKIEEIIDLQDVLTELGLGEIFTSSANFDGVLKNSNQLGVDKAIHKACIEVNEERTEAAAATAFRLMPLCSRPPPEQFCANHPFVILLQVKVNGEAYVLFMGRIASPKYG